MVFKRRQEKKKTKHFEMCIYFLRTQFQIENMIQQYSLKPSAYVHLFFVVVISFL